MSNSDHMAANGDPILTVAQRARLRSTVDRDALETFLRAVPKYATVALSHFSEELTPADTAMLMGQLGATPTEISAFERAATSESEDEVIVVRVVATPPGRPDQRALWEAIEPQRAS